MSVKSFPHTIADLPDVECYAILRPVGITIPGDEISRTNPGHGYPERTSEHWDIELFPTKEAWAAEIKRLQSGTLERLGYSPKPFKAVRMIPAKITIKVEIE